MRLLQYLAGFSAITALCACATSEPVPMISPAPTVAETTAETNNSESTEPLEPVVVHVRPAPVTADTVVCRRVVSTGTHIKRQRCVSERQLRRERAASQEWMQTDGRSGSTVTIAR